VQKISKPGFLAEGLRFPTATLGKPTSSRSEAVFSDSRVLVDHATSLAMLEATTNATRAKVPTKISMGFILPAASYADFVTKCTVVSVTRLRHKSDFVTVSERI
jgi:hypothetical protein